MAEQVICVDNENPGNGFWPGDRPTKGQIYTIRERVRSGGQRGVHLHELYGGEYRGREIAFREDRFAPIKDENIEVFRAMDRKIFDKKKIDA